MSKLEMMRSKIAGQLAARREGVRRTVDLVEIGVGAYGSGFLAAQFPSGVGGVPVDAASALILGSAGWALKQRDLMSIAIGVGAGFLRAKGEEAGLRNPMTSEATTAAAAAGFTVINGGS